MTDTPGAALADHLLTWDATGTLTADDIAVACAMRMRVLTDLLAHLSGEVTRLRDQERARVQANEHQVRAAFADTLTRDEHGMVDQDVLVAYRRAMLEASVPTPGLRAQVTALSRLHDRCLAAVPVIRVHDIAERARMR